MIDAIFKDKTVAIVGGGPSLIGANLKRLSGYNVIAINLAFESLPDATLLWWQDAHFWRWFRDKLEAHRAPYKATGDDGYKTSDNLPAAVTQYRFTGTEGFDPDPGCLRTGNCSAYAAMHLAIHLGAQKIVLFGIDMKHGPNGEKNFHRGYGIYQDPKIFEDLMIPHFKGLIEPLAERKIEVVNASPDSALTLWPRCTVEEGFKALGAATLQTRGDPPVVESPVAEADKPADQGRTVEPD